MEGHGSLSNHSSAWGLANSITVQMTLRAAIELNVVNIIAKSVVLWGSEMLVMNSYSMLKYTVLEPGSSPFLKGHGESMYEYMSKKPELCQLFDKVMGVISYLYFDHKVFEVYKGFEEVKELMDVGGGDGTAIAKIVSMYGVEHLSGDMFELIPKTQSVMLMLILHNWNDDHFENTPDIKLVLYIDIVMMAMFQGAKERTTAEYDTLAKSVGFVETKIFPLPHGRSYILEFLKGGSVESIVG
uniref:(S)-scoulerine 9-O-methyltransferase-like n=1 Tax=Fragaria vesca subsp. vesca TaxID=101020 RepID=UPI0005C90479|nr:PREDICTED: (S)-scoulerine 9-O-methyltransferase-like [Fragaria vesca subsp. vesca]